MSVRSGRGGFTLLELLITLAISSIAVATIVGVFMYYGRVQRANSMRLKFAQTARILVDRVKIAIRESYQVQVLNSGKELRLTMGDGTTCAFRYQNSDGNDETIEDNQIVYVPNIDAGTASVVAQYVSPIDRSYFFYNVNPGEPVYFRFRIGDISDDPSHRCHAITGPGFQSVTVDTVVSARNTQM